MKNLGKKVWMVVGSSGYVNITYWLVCTYPNQKDAEKHIKHLMEWLGQHSLTFNDCTGARKSGKQNPYDQNFRYSEEGTEYFLMNSDLFEKFTGAEVYTDRMYHED